ncbi:alpha/beta fold hydrolase [Acidaminobacter sp. JC074]|uniref:proline iminopeptidase-family hydrolase n=1 Tax=Acidaminobacter sp. JC074 TaxID=2530199 RepID=UPI001F0EFBCF|nr:proline iminopeptidase-family hydrolase [Acidaminobacter sp. JC074]MCH4887841.1 alpha/beta fold hydrolase [Acidaminobacter sp. JC074]
MLDQERFVEIEALGEKLKVWTKKFGDNEKLKVLMLHGGPGGSCEGFENFIEPFEKAGFEFYFYNQLGSYLSDDPGDVKYWTFDRFVDEVEQVRKALNLTKDNFILFGHSWGGMLAMEYALKYQDRIKGLVLSSMVASIPDYNRYEREVLAPKLGPDFLSEITKLEEKKDFGDRYNELIMPFYESFVLRIPQAKWPEPILRMVDHLNHQVYNYMNGPSEFGCIGTFKDWDVKNRLKEIAVPTLVIGAKYNTMNPDETKWMADEVSNGHYLFCPNGSHMCHWDDSDNYFDGLVNFINTL